MKKYFLLSLVLALTLTACGAPTAEVTPTPEPTPTEEVTPTPELTPTSEPAESPTPGALTEEELEWFEKVFFWSNLTNIRNVFGSPFSCTYADARDINLAQLFGDSCLLRASEGEIRLLVRQGAFPELRDEVPGEEGGYICPVYYLTREEMNKTLEKYTGLTLRMTNQVGLDRLPYLEEYDAYYWCFGDTGYPGPLEILSGVRKGSSVRLYQRGPGDTLYRLVLEQQPEGNYRFVSNLPVPDADQVPLPADPAAAERTRYFFAGSHFLGGWSDGQWRSCETEQFTLGEIFNRDYYDVWGETLNSARFYAGEGPGSFESGAMVIDLLEPFGIMEGYDFVMKLPGQLTGEAAQVVTPDYNFYVYFEGQPHYFVSNVPIESPSYRKDNTFLLDEAASPVLEGVGIHCDPFNMSREVWACDMDGDGQKEYLELIQTPCDESGYAILEPGDQCFYAFLLRDGDRVSVVASRAIDYTTDVTSHFSAGDAQFHDLDGDGVCEIIFNERCWEWGFYEAYSLIDGAWTPVLRSDYGT